MGPASDLRMVAGPAALHETHLALERVWKAHRQIPDAVRMDTSIAVGEIVANIVEHGCAGRHLVVIEMQIEVQRDRVLVVLIDDGNEPGVDLGTVRMPDHFAESGRGLAMAQLSLETLVYQRHPDGNHWLLTSKPF